MATGDFITANNFISGYGFTGTLQGNHRYLTGHQLIINGYMDSVYYDPCGGGSTIAGGTLYIYQWNGTEWILIYTHSNATTNSFTLTFNRNGVNASYFPQWRITSAASTFGFTNFYSNNTHCKGGNNTAGKRIYYCYNDHNSQTPNWGFQIGTPITWDYAKNLTDGYNSP